MQEFFLGLTVVFSSESDIQFPACNFAIRHPCFADTRFSSVADRSHPDTIVPVEAAISVGVWVVCDIL